MKDARDVLDAVRKIVPGNAKLLVVWCEDADGAPLHCSQANMSYGDIEKIGVNLSDQAKASNRLKVSKDKSEFSRLISIPSR